MNRPVISVLLPCYNSEATLQESVASILAQTFADFELLLLDDGSTQPVENIADPRVQVIRSEKNLGLGAQLNLGIEQAQGEFIARIDADDIAAPERFQKQLNLLNQSPEIGICGSQAQLFDASGDQEIWNYPSDPDDCHATLFVRSSFLHPGVLIRKELLETLRYDESLKVAQDYELWTRLLKVTQGTNHTECLTHYRVSDSQLTKAHSDTKVRETLLIRQQILDELEINGIEIYSEFLSDEWEENAATYLRIAAWLNAVIAANKTRQAFPPEALKKLLAEIFSPPLPMRHAPRFRRPRFLREARLR